MIRYNIIIFNNLLAIIRPRSTFGVRNIIGPLSPVANKDGLLAKVDMRHDAIKQLGKCSKIKKSAQPLFWLSAFLMARLDVKSSIQPKKALPGVSKFALREGVRPTGFEPATCGTGIRHSIHLSYGRIFWFFCLENLFSDACLSGQGVSDAILRFGGDYYFSFHFLPAKFANYVEAPLPP